jgi:hypothetical protein
MDIVTFNIPEEFMEELKNDAADVADSTVRTTVQHAKDPRAIGTRMSVVATYIVDRERFGGTRHLVRLDYHVGAYLHSDDVVGRNLIELADKMANKIGEGAEVLGLKHRLGIIKPGSQ